MAAPVLRLRVPEDTLARLDGTRGEETRSAWILRLIDRELTGQQTTSGSAAKDTLTTSPTLASMAAGEPSPGVVCMGPGWWERNTAKYGLRRIPLCPPAPPPSVARSTSGRYRQAPYAWPAVVPKSCLATVLKASTTSAAAAPNAT